MPPMDAEEHASRTCSRCGQRKPTTDFPLRRRDGARRQSHCRACKAAYQADWYAENRARHILAVEATRRARLERNRRLVREAKDRPCADCGQRYPPYVLDFDHVRGQKSWAIASQVRDATLERLREEIAKCDVVCANCHRERTYGPRGRGAGHPGGGDAEAGAW